MTSQSRRKSHQAAAYGALAVLGALLPLAPPAHAGSPARAVDTLGLHPVTGRGLWTVDTGEGLGHLTLRAAGVMSYANRSLWAGASDGVDLLAVEHLAQLDLSVALGLGRFSEVAVALPLGLYVQGAQGGNGLAPTTLGASTVGDLRLVPKIRLWGGAGDAPGPALALVAEMDLPTGSPEANATAGAVTFAPRLAASWRLAGAAVFAVNLGYRGRPGLDAGSFEAAHAFTYGVGTEVSLGAGVRMGAEVYGAVTERGEGNAAGGASLLPLEGLLGVRYGFGRGLTASLAGAAGFTAGLATPRYRVLASLGWRAGLATAFVDTDRDDDGVDDADDACPDVPAIGDDGDDTGDGCPRPDRDHDGVCDARPETQGRAGEWAGICQGADQCPEEPEDRDGFQDDDGCPDPDNDGDGLADGADQCPDGAEDRDGFQDDDGCPDPDNDGDGVPDEADQCPDRPETRNGLDDEDGCPDTRVEGAKFRGDVIEVTGRVYFDVGRATLRPKSAAVIETIAEVLREHPEVTKLRVAGHTDARGDEAKNQALSQRRAEAVTAALVRAGIDTRRLEARGYGSSAPVCRQDTAECRAKNRRTEFVVVEVQGRPVKRATPASP